MSQELTEFLVTEHLKKGIIEADVIDLKIVNSNLTGKVESLDKQIEKLILANSLRDSIIAVTEEQRELTKKELRKEKRKAVGTWLKNNYEKILIGVGGVAVGVAVGKFL